MERPPEPKTQASTVSATTATETVDSSADHTAGAGKPKIADGDTLPRRDHSKWRPGMPMVRAGACPGESCYYGYPVVACQDLPLRSTDSFAAKEIGTVTKGDTATLVTGNLHLTEPGIVLIKRDYAITDIEDGGESYGPAKDTLRFFAGDTLYVLDYLELGSWSWWYRGKEGAGNEFWSGPLQRSFAGKKNLPAVSISEPRGEWWYELRSRTGSDGWVRTNGKGWWEERKFVRSDRDDWKCPG